LKGLFVLLWVKLVDRDYLWFVQEARVVGHLCFEPGLKLRPNYVTSFTQSWSDFDQ